MAVIYATGVQTSRMTVVLTAIDAGGSAGKLKIYASNGSTLLAVLPLSYPCGTVGGSSPSVALTLGTITTDAAGEANGTAALASITTSADTVVGSGLTVGTSGSNINLNTTSITTSGSVSMSSGVLTHNSAG
jgi:hypothetical protein